ncbi:hypothetical protein BMR33_25740 [Escherichia coli]|nr:hypothetical protein A8M68_25290 [Escherichia coli]OWF14267.1 hypothetical protein A8M74_31640 [Escherichia coli]PGG55738.1 hypothetical protein BMR33_25740 [Escherichia coli]
MIRLKVITGLQEQKSYLKTVMERNLITTKILMIHKGLLGLVIIRDWLDITNLFLMQPETI